jgi:hypothetical protein
LDGAVGPGDLKARHGGATDAGFQSCGGRTVGEEVGVEGILAAATRGSSLDLN